MKVARVSNEKEHPDRLEQAPMASPADHVRDQPDAMRFSAEDQARIARALSSPPAPNAALRRAFERHRTLSQTGS
jgi:uncharacterized protein (DUF1778 family)